MQPSTAMIDAVINSVWKMLGESIFRTIIVLDGYKIESQSRTKKGKVTKEIAANYELYYNKLIEKYGTVNRTQVIRCLRHVGFAYAVKTGLELCKTTYAFVIQHDRIFRKLYSPISDLVHMMESYPHIRYIGFPSIMNCNHEIILNSKYSLSTLTSATYKLAVDEKFSLLPLIFWYDSNHFCHVQRYLQIYRPYTFIPVEIQYQINKNNPHENMLKKMLLKYGDFIEDRFGQIQRNLFVGSNKNAELLSSLIHWYGAYLLWPTLANKDSHIYDRIFVSHLRGRKCRPEDTIRYFEETKEDNNNITGDIEVDIEERVSEKTWDDESDEPYCELLLMSTTCTGSSSSSSCSSCNSPLFNASHDEHGDDDTVQPTEGGESSATAT